MFLLVVGVTSGPASTNPSLYTVVTSPISSPLTAVTSSRTLRPTTNLMAENNLLAWGYGTAPLENFCPAGSGSVFYLTDPTLNNTIFISLQISENA